ncbi:hypothetical protein V8C86DRAFT_222037 [Haematococcus lacustris]
MANAELQTEELCALQAIYADDCQVDTVGRTAQVYIPHAKHVPSCVLTILMPDSYPSSSPPVAQLHATHLSDDVCQAACAHLQQLWAPGEVVVHTWVEWLKEQRHLFTVGGQPEAALADSHGAMEKEEEEGEEGGRNPEHEGEDEEQRQDHGGVIGVAQCSARLGGCRGPVEGQLTQSRPRAKQVRPSQQEEWCSRSGRLQHIAAAANELCPKSHCEEMTYHVHPHGSSQGCVYDPKQVPDPKQLPDPQQVPDPDACGLRVSGPDALPSLPLVPALLHLLNYIIILADWDSASRSVGYKR